MKPRGRDISGEEGRGISGFWKTQSCSPSSCSSSSSLVGATIYRWPSGLDPPLCHSLGLCPSAHTLVPPAVLPVATLTLYPAVRVSPYPLLLLRRVLRNENAKRNLRKNCILRAARFPGFPSIACRV